MHCSPLREKAEVLELYRNKPERKEKDHRGAPVGSRCCQRTRLQNISRPHRHDGPFYIYISLAPQTTHQRASPTPNETRAATALL
jgi:hypothetical protein